MSLDREALNTILLYVITAAGAVIAATWLGLILWTWRDIRQRSRDPLAPIAASLMVAVLGLFGIIIYVLLRPQETLTEAYERSLEEEALLQNIEDAIMLKVGSKREIASSDIGDEALKQLREVDLVAYVRFAAVYKAFNDLGQFIAEIQKLGKELA